MFCAQWAAFQLMVLLLDPSLNIIRIPSSAKVKHSHDAFIHRSSKFSLICSFCLQFIRARNVESPFETLVIIVLHFCHLNSKLCALNVLKVVMKHATKFSPMWTYRLQCLCAKSSLNNSPAQLFFVLCFSFFALLSC